MPGDDAFMSVASRVWRMKRGRVARAAFPPQQIAEVKAVACEPPSEGAPLSRRSTADVHRLVVERGIGDASESTIVRWRRRYPPVAVLLLDLPGRPVLCREGRLDP
jgi:hypothetical protein